MSSPISRRSSRCIRATASLRSSTLRLLHLPAAEREQLPRERGRPLGGAADRFRLAPQRVVRAPGGSSSSSL